MKENADMHLSRIGGAVRANYIALFTCALMLSGALFISYIMVKLAIVTVRNYYALLPSSNAAKTAAKKKAKTKALNADDDVAYPEEVAAAGLASNLQDSDNSRIKASIDTLKKRYSSYNAAMSDYATRVQGRTADDLMDEKILSRENDDFRYTSTAKKI